ncbi:MAG: DUF3817 domain-containing protein [Myxococcota bacterium]
MISAYLTWRFVKWIAIALFTTGLALSVVPQSGRTRRIGAFAIATPGLLAIWLTGYGLMKNTGAELSDPHIQYTLIAGLIALVGAVFGAVFRHRSPGLALSVAGLAAATGLMTSRGDPTALWVLGGVVPAVLGAIAGGIGFALPKAPADPVAANRSIHTWFSWIARGEGISLLVLFGVFMPLRYGAGIEIDGGDGWVGWVHGVMVFVYLLGLGTGVVISRWGILAAILGFVASILPFGTFAFEWWLKRKLAKDPAPAAPAAGQ